MLQILIILCFCQFGISTNSDNLPVKNTGMIPFAQGLNFNIIFIIVYKIQAHK